REAPAAGHTFGQHRLESHGREVAFILNDAALLQFAQTFLNRLGIIADALEAAFMQQAFLGVRKIEQAPLERGGAEIGDEDFHDANSEFRIPNSERTPKIEMRIVIATAVRTLAH